MGNKDYYATVMRLPDVVERVQHARVMELSGGEFVREQQRPVFNVGV